MRPTTTQAALRAALAAVVAAASVAALCYAFVLANFGAPWGSFALLVLVPLTIGLPTTLAGLLVVSLWDGPPLWGFVGTCVVAGAIAQWLAFWGLRRLLARRASARAA